VAPLGRSYWMLVAALAYACVEAARSGGGLLSWFALLVLPLLLAEAHRRSERARARGALWPESLPALRASVFGGLLMVAARTGGSARPTLDAVANLGAACAAVGALLVLARLPTRPGMFAPSRSARSLDAALFVGVLWGVAMAVPATYALLPAPLLRFDPLLIDYLTTAAGAGTLLVFVAATLRLRTLRRLELDIGDRARAASALSITAFLVAIPAAWLDVAAPDRVLPAACVVVALCCIWAAIARDATLVTRLVRGLLAVTILGAPLMVLAPLVARHFPERGPLIVLLVAGLSIAVGLLTHAVARPLGPERSRWLLALDQAARDALEPEPRAALRAALIALSRIHPAPGGSAQIWQRQPAEALRVDIAGNLGVERADAPAALYELGLREPERTVRAEVLRALRVRRPDLRELLGWFDSLAAFSATIIVDEEGPIGFVLLPRGTRKSAMILEEARAARLLADRISSLLSIVAALGRARDRELAATERAERADDECQRLEHVIHGEARRLSAFAERLARPARRAAYSASARTALEAVERLGTQVPFVALVAPRGVDAVAWAALVHCSSPRREGPLVLVDLLSSSDDAAGLGDDESRSFLRFADGGTLVVLGLTAQPLEVHDKFAIALSRRAAHVPRSSILPPGVVITSPLPLEEAVSRGLLSPNLARWFADAELRLPSLAERSEDLRALALDQLARKSVELARPAAGIEPSALRLLLEHAWPENELELALVLGRALAVAEGPAVTAADLERTGFSPVEPRAQSVEPRPAVRRRASFRPR
jgi:hypothetical protein